MLRPYQNEPGSFVANQFDVIVLGGGPAGYVCAIRCAQLGLQTAVIEQEKLGGVCVNIGCIPTKALLHSAYIANLLKESKDFGVEAGDVKTDYGVAMKRSRRVADQNSKGVEFLMKKHKITVVRGTGVLQPGKKVKVGSDVYEARKAVVIATGSRVKGIPQIGLEINKTTVISSDEALLMEKIPATLAIIGAVAAAVLMAAGRAVNTENIDLKECGIQLTDRGFIKIDKNMQTATPGYYAIGDVAGPPMLAHKGSREGVIVAELLAGQKPHPLKYDNVPSVTYCHPEAASIALTEDQCTEKN